MERNRCYLTHQASSVLIFFFRPFDNSAYMKCIWNVPRISSWGLFPFHACNRWKCISLLTLMWCTIQQIGWLHLCYWIIRYGLRFDWNILFLRTVNHSAPPVKCFFLQTYSLQFRFSRFIFCMKCISDHFQPVIRLLIHRLTLMWWAIQQMER